MRVSIFWFFLLLLLLVQAPCFAQHVTDSDYCIRNVNIINPEKKQSLLWNRDVYIKDGIIVKIKKSSNKPPVKDKQSVDGTGMFLMAGLADMHAHIPQDNREKYMLMNLAAGVTTLRSMRGDTSHIRLKKEVEQGKITGPDLIISAPPITARTAIQADELSAVVASYKQAGFDLIKVLSIPDSSFFEKLMFAANTHNVPVAGHSPIQVPVEKVIESGYSSIEHLQGLIAVYQQDASALAPLINSLKAKQIYNCPTLDWYQISTMQYSVEELKERKGLEYVDPLEMKDWVAQVENRISLQSQRDQDSVMHEKKQANRYMQQKLELVKLLHSANAPLLLSPDASGIFAVPGFSVFEEMKLYSKAGLNNQEILKIATYNPAACMRQQHSWGSVEKGKKANLILLRKNPLDAIEHIQGIESVISQGKYMITADMKSKLSQPIKL
jgi:imidazolonepropionase-like amidohydrolase